MLSYAAVRGDEVIPSTGEVDVRLAMLALLEGTYVLMTTTAFITILFLVLPCPALPCPMLFHFILHIVLWRLKQMRKLSNLSYSFNTIMMKGTLHLSSFSVHLSMDCFTFFNPFFKPCHLINVNLYLDFDLNKHQNLMSDLIRSGSSDWQCSEYITKAADRLLSVAIVPNLVWRVR